MIRIPGGVKCVSFDVFDTLLIRKYFRPIDLFHDLSNSLINEVDGLGNFPEVRINAEFELRKQNNFSKEVCLDDIYVRIQEELSLSDKDTEKIKTDELLLEQTSITFIKEMVDFVNECRDKNYDIIFTSDIYLPESHIHSLLKQFDIYKQKDEVFVSSSISLMKSNGELFHYILEKRNLKPRELFHIGDNNKSDYAVPDSMGIGAFHYQGSINNRYEGNENNNLIISKFVGASRATRLQPCKDIDNNRTIWNVTANVSAPLIFSMVSWCIRHAIDKGIKRLYFLSRDGQIMYRVAKEIISRFYNDKIQVHYLYVSRQALLFPAVADIDNEALGWILAPTWFLTPRIILKRINFEPEEVENWLKEGGFLTKIDKHLTPLEKDDFRKILIAHKQEIMERVDQYKRNTLEYFKQEGLIEKGNFGVVDIGWNGTLQRSISRLLDIGFEYKEPVTGYYFGVKSRNLHKPNDDMHAWFSDCEKQRQLDKDAYIIPMTELFTAADHGGVIRYEMRHNEMKPVLKSEENKSGLDWGVGTQHEAIMSFTRQALDMLSRSDLEDSDTCVIDYLESNYRKFFIFPESEEAQAYGSYPAAEDQNESYYIPMAQPYSLIEVLKSKLNPVMHHHNEWRAASIIISSPLSKILMR